jgi:hypothetical protein
MEANHAIGYWFRVKLPQGAAPGSNFVVNFPQGYKTQYVLCTVPQTDLLKPDSNSCSCTSMERGGGIDEILVSYVDPGTNRDTNVRTLEYYSADNLCNVEWCIRKSLSSITSYNNSSIPHTHHTHIYPLLNIDHIIITTGTVSNSYSTSSASEKRQSHELLFIPIAYTIFVHNVPSILDGYRLQRVL